MLKEYTCNVPYAGWYVLKFGGCSFNVALSCLNYILLYTVSIFLNSLFCCRSSAYTVATILIQLQSFLFEENAIPQDYGGSCNNFPGSSTVTCARKCAAVFKCPGCSHGSVVNKLTRSVWPPLPRTPIKIERPKTRCAVKIERPERPESKTKSAKYQTKTVKSKKRKKQSKKKSKNKGTCEEKVNVISRRASSGLLDLEDFLWLHMCSYIAIQDVHRLRQVCVRAARVHYKYNIVCRREMVCFHR